MATSIGTGVGGPSGAVRGESLASAASPSSPSSPGLCSFVRCQQSLVVAVVARLLAHTAHREGKDVHRSSSEGTRGVVKICAPCGRPLGLYACMALSGRPSCTAGNLPHHPSGGGEVRRRRAGSGAARCPSQQPSFRPRRLGTLGAWTECAE